MCAWVSRVNVFDSRRKIPLNSAGNTLEIKAERRKKNPLFVSENIVSISPQPQAIKSSSNHNELQLYILTKKKVTSHWLPPCFCLWPFEKFNESSKPWRHSSHFTFPFKDVMGRKCKKKRRRKKKKSTWLHFLSLIWYSMCRKQLSPTVVNGPAYNLTPCMRKKEEHRVGSIYA